MADAKSVLRQLGRPHSRSEAMDDLREMGSDAVPLLIQGLEHYNEGVRWAAAKLLTQLGTPQALEALEAHREDPDIGFQAVQAIEAIRKKASGTVGAENGPTAALSLSDEALLNQVVEGTSWELSRTREGWMIKVELPGTRQHTVYCIVQPPSDKGTPLVLIYTECGPARPEIYEWALKMNAKMPFGAIALRELNGELLFVMVNSFLRDTVTPKDIQKSVSRLAKEADTLESQLTSGADKY